MQGFGEDRGTGIAFASSSLKLTNRACPRLNRLNDTKQSIQSHKFYCTRPGSRYR